MKTKNNANNYYCSLKNINNIFNKINKNYYSQSYMLTPNNNNSKLDYIRDILLDNNIKSCNEINKNHYKYYTNLYNFNLAQSTLQNKGFFFNIKNMSNLPFQKTNNNNIPNFNNELKINSYFYNLNNVNNINNFSIRELYRNLNSENYSSYSHLINKNKKNNKKKRAKKSFEYKINNNNNNNNISKRKFNLTNLQYDCKSAKNKYAYENLFLTKRYTHLNFYKNIKSDLKGEYHCFKRKKNIGNYFQNLLKKKNINDIKDDILDIGLINSSSQQKIGKNEIKIKQMKQ